MWWRAVALLMVGSACSRPDPARTAPVEEPTGPIVLSGDDPPEAMRARERLVGRLERELRLEPKVADALRAVPRHRFVAATIATAYEDRPLPIGLGQTISQPGVVAMMTNALALSGEERVLEIGTGSGYQAAVLALLSKRVFSIEILPELGDRAKALLAALGYSNVEVRIGDGYRGWPEQAPFDRIILTAAPPSLPRELVEQLRPGGLIIAPVGERGAQKLVRYRKTESGLTEESLADVTFVPMVPGR
jgi:protein-L-isoaspartate(D-aspartate) O-methyltransferase